MAPAASAATVNKAHKLNARIVGRRPLAGHDKFGLEHVDVEWTHASGPMKDTRLEPKFDPKTRKAMVGPDNFLITEEIPDGERDVIKDQVDVPVGTDDEVVIGILAGKRAILAAKIDMPCCEACTQAAQLYKAQVASAEMALIKN